MSAGMKGPWNRFIEAIEAGSAYSSVACVQPREGFAVREAEQLVDQQPDQADQQDKADKMDQSFGPG